MMARKGEIASQIYRQQLQSKSLDDNPKAASLAPTSISNQQNATSDRLENAIQTYCDYFIRY
jgi:hypothetical protein